MKQIITKHTNPRISSFFLAFVRAQCLSQPTDGLIVALQMQFYV